MSRLPPSLIAELCRVFDSTRHAMLCAMSHGQVTIDGHVMKPEFDRRWRADQLAGRYAELCGRQVQLFGSRPADRTLATHDSG